MRKLKLEPGDTDAESAAAPIGRGAGGGASAAGRPVVGAIRNAEESRMHRFWSTLIAPLLSELSPRVIVEVGADRGANTRRLLEYARDHDAVLHSIDTTPRLPVEEWRAEFGERFAFHPMLSLNALPRIGAVDAALIDGDHNWYTVFHELEALAQASREAGKPFPLVLLHDLGWPYGRRDLYYDPDTVPAAFQKPFRRAGMRPDSADLIERGGLNAHLNNAIYEAGAQNGVATAVEDFLRRSRRKLKLLTVPGFHGLGILYTAEHAERSPLLRRLSAQTADALLEAGCLDALERSRVEAEISLQEASHRLRQARGEVEAKTAELEELAGRLESGRAEIASLRASLDERSAELERRREELEVRRTQNANLAAQGEEQEAEARKLRAALDASRAQVEGLETRLREAGGESAPLREELETARTVAERSESQLREASGELATLRARAAELEEEQRASARARAELRETSQRAAGLERDLARRGAELEALGADLEIKESELVHTARRLKAGEEEARELCGAVEAGQARVAELERRAEAEAVQLAALADQLAARDREQTRLAARAESDRGEIERGRAALARAEKECTGLVEERDRSEAENGELRRALAASSARVEALGARERERELELRDLAGRLEQRTLAAARRGDEVRAAQREAEQLHARLRAEGDGRRELELRVHRQGSELAALHLQRAELEQLVSRAEERADERERAAAESESRGSARAVRLRELEAELATLRDGDRERGELERREAELRELRAERDRLAEERDRAELRRGELEAERSGLEARAQNLVAERSRLNLRKDDLVAERAQLRGSIAGLSEEAERLREQRARADAELEALEGEIAEYDAWMRQLVPHVTKVLESRRLRLGNAAGDLASKLLRRPVIPMDGTIRRVFSEYRERQRSAPRARSERRDRPAAERAPAAREAPRRDAALPAPGPRPRAAGDAPRKRKVCYTAIAGGYDAIKSPLFASDDFDYVCFSDDERLSSDVWQIRRFDYHNADPTRMARHAKLHPHVYFPDYEVSIWVDANLLIKGDLEEFVEALGDHAIATFPHPHRQCIYDEAREVIARGGLDVAEVIERQVARYEREGYPRQRGLAETNVVVRRHNEPRVIELMNAWWREIDNGSKRDQLSLDYCAHQLSVEVGALAERGVSVRNDPRVERFLHGDESAYRPSEPEAGARPVRVEVPFGVERPSQAALEALDRLSVDIVVCIHNGRDDVERCLDSVYANLGENHRVIAIDDGSEPETAEFVRRHLEGRPRTIAVRHERAGGYTKAANVGLENSTADYVILLNSDTIVSPNWALKLMRCAESAPDIGIVGPLSNAASWQSIPAMLDAKGQLAINELPRGYEPCHLDQLVELWAPPIYPRVALLNGFCFAIKRAVIERVGRFDEVSFPHGYGEENDYCFRTTDAGFALAVATDTYVYHAKSKSYTHERRAVLSRAGSQALRSIYTGERIVNGIESMKRNPLIGRVREGVGRFLEQTVAGERSGRSDLSALFLTGPDPRPGEARSLVAEVLSLRALGADARIALPERAADAFRSVYRSDADALILSFADDRELLERAGDFTAAVATDADSLAHLRALCGAHPDTLPAFYAHDSASGEALCEAWTGAPLPGLVVLSKTDAMRARIERETGLGVHKVHFNKDSAEARGAPFERQVRDAASCSGRRTALSQLLVLGGASALRGDAATPGPRPDPAGPAPEPRPAAAASPAPGPARPGTRLATRVSSGLRRALAPVTGGRSKLRIDREVLSYDVTPEILEANERVVSEFRRRPDVTPASALWFVPNFEHILRGGLRTIFATAESFTQRWGTRSAIALYGQDPPSVPPDAIREQIRTHFPGLDFELVQLVGDQGFDRLPEADVAFSTLWTSAYLLARYNRCRGKFYFVQDYEPAFYAAGSVFGLIEQTYRFGFTAICNTPGVAEHYRRYSPWVGCFTPGVDRGLFRPEAHGDRRGGPRRVVFYGRPRNSRNGFRLGVEALARVKQYFGGGVEIISVGADFSTEEFGIGHVLENRGVLSTMEEVAALYRSADVGLVFMYTAHPSYQPLEYMASGCATVTNFNPNNSWLLRDDDNAFLSESTVGCVAERIVRALEDDALRRRVVEGGLRTVEPLDWSRAFADIQAFVSQPRPAERSFLDPGPSRQSQAGSRRGRKRSTWRGHRHGDREHRGSAPLGGV